MWPARQRAAGSSPGAGGRALASAESQVERGRCLIIGGGCHDCHTPKKMGPNGPEADMARMLSGHPESDGRAAAIQAEAKGSPYVDRTSTST